MINGRSTVDINDVVRQRKKTNAINKNREQIKKYIFSLDDN